MMDLVGQQFGNYRIEAPLGRGGIADVYRASDADRGRPVALKILRPELSADPAFVARFRAAAPRLAALAHPQIVPILDWGEHDGRCYLALAFAPTGSLRHLFEQQGEQPPSLRVALGLALHAAEGLAHAHAQGLVHGDIRPENLLLAEAGPPHGGYLLQVADCGLADLVEGLLDVGAPAYLAPEQLRGQRATPQSDIYALGVVLYEALTGRPPFPVTSFADAVHLHSQEEPPPPRAHRPDIAIEHEAITLRCLAKDPADRYAAAADLAAALRRALAAAGPRTAADGAGEPPPAATPAPAPPEASQIRLIPRDTANLLLTPGTPTIVGLAVTNHGTTVERVALTVEGTPRHWIGGLDGPIEVAPGGVVGVELTVTVERDPQSPAGEYPVTIRAGHDPARPLATIAALWEVVPFTAGELHLAPTRAGGKTGAAYTARLQNLGNAPLRRALVATVPAGLACTLTPALVDLDPGALATIDVRVTAPRRWLGPTRATPFAIEATSASATPLRAEGTFAQRAQVPVWLLALATLGLIALALALAVLLQPTGAHNLTTDAPTATAVVAADPAAEPTAGPSPSGAPATTPGTAAAARAGATPAAGLSVSATLLNFGSLPIGTSGVQTLQVKNSSTSPIAFRSVQIAGAAVADFVRSGPCGTLALDPGRTCPITVIFTPTSAGNRTASLTITPIGGEAQAVIITGTGTSVGTAQIVAPTKPPPAMAGVRGGHAAAPFAEGQRLLVTGGRNGLNQLKSVEIYDLVANAWTGGRDMGVPRAGHTATSLPDGTVLVLGGRSGPNTLKSGEVYDPRTQGWSAFPDMATGREGHTATLLRDPRTRDYQILVLGGRDQNGVALTSGEVYDSASRRWTETPGLIPNGRAGHTATLLKQEAAGTPRILIVGGLDREAVPAPAEIYDPTGAGTWTAVPGMPADLAASGDYTATLLEATGVVLFLGGASGGLPGAAATIYDPAAAPDQAWREAPEGLATPRSGHTATLLPYGQILLTGGRTGPRESAGTELFDPRRVASAPASAR